MNTSPSSRQRMTPVDRMWLRMDHPTNLMMITGVTFFPEPVERTAVLEVLQDRLLAIPRFRWRVIAADRGSGHHWETDENLDLDWHLQEVTLPNPGDDAALREFVNGWMSTPLDAERPLWQVHLIQNHNQGSAMLWRLHHCIGDGIALMLAMLSLTDLEPEAEGREGNPLAELFSSQPPAPAEAKAHLHKVLPEAVKLLSQPAETLGRSVAGRRVAPRCPLWDAWLCVLRTTRPFFGVHWGAEARRLVRSHLHVGDQPGSAGVGWHRQRCLDQRCSWGPASLSRRARSVAQPAQYPGYRACQSEASRGHELAGQSVRSGISVVAGGDQRYP